MADPKAAPPKPRISIPVKSPSTGGLSRPPGAVALPGLGAALPPPIASRPPSMTVSSSSPTIAPLPPAIAPLPGAPSTNLNRPPSLTSAPPPIAALPPAVGALALPGLQAGLLPRRATASAPPTAPMPATPPPAELLPAPTQLLTPSSSASSLSGVSPRSPVVALRAPSPAAPGSPRTIASGLSGSPRASVSGSPRASVSASPSPRSEEIPSEETPSEVDETPESKEEARLRKLQCAADEILSTEEYYVEKLRILLNRYLKPMCLIATEENLAEPSIQSAWNALLPILPIHEKLLEALRERINNWHAEQDVADIFLKFGPLFRNYSKFVSEYNDVLQAVDNCMAKSVRFNEFVNGCREDVNHKLDNLLRDPIARLPRYPMLLEALMKRTPEELPSYNMLQKAITLLEDIAQAVDQAYNKQKQNLEFTEVINEFHDSTSLIVAHRKLLRRGDVSLYGQQAKTVHLVLCSDLLIVFPNTKPRSTTKIADAQYAWPLPVVWVSDNSTTSDSPYFTLLGPLQRYDLAFDTEVAKREWLEAIANAITANAKGAPVGPVRSIKTALVFNSNVESLPIKYKGEFRLGKLEGEGKFTWFGQVYKGNWLGNCRSGYGEFTCFSGDRYTGEWQDNKPHGKGTMTYTSDSKYIGEWFNGLPHGKGIMVWLASGEKYEGEWQVGVPSGYGIYTCHTGHKYQGYWANGRMHGEGELSAPSGSVYKGKFVGGAREGAGIMRYATGDVYNGTWKQDRRDGKGTLTTSAGNYEGDFADDELHGKGTMTYRCGHSYSGSWKHNQYHGKGVLKFNQGNVVSQIMGIWSQGALDGDCKFSFGDVVMKLKMKDGLPHGAGALAFQVLGQKLEIKYQEGIRDAKKATPCNAKSSFTQIDASLTAMAIRSFGVPPDVFDPFFV